METKKILQKFALSGIDSSDGNIIFPSGNALAYLQDYFTEQENIVNPYIENPEDIRSICISPNGDVLGGNIYQTDILELLTNYSPD